jgi:hypothetical protein
MLKWMAIFALALNVVSYAHAKEQAPAKDPAQTTNPSGTHAPVAHPKKSTGESLAQGTENGKPIDEPKTVRVILPAKDGYDRWAFWISVVLAGVGILGIGVGICTLLFIKAQVLEMRRQRIA